MNSMSTEDLAEHLDKLDAASVEDLDELLEDLLVKPWPTKIGQDN